CTVRSTRHVSVGPGRGSAARGTRSIRSGKPLAHPAPGQRRAGVGMTLPLDGVLVADFSRVLAGPSATSLLGDLGARVIKVERPGVGDDTRAWGPPWTSNGASYFESANRNKESVTLDLRDAEDLA